MTDSARANLEAEILAFIDTDPTAAAPERFDELALRLWRWHTEAMPDYRRFCVERLGTLDRVRDWRQIPPLPVDAFKLAELACPSPSGVARRFSTSGTTGGARPGLALFAADDLRLMDAAIRQNARHMLFADGARCRILVLAPSPVEAPHIIMSYGMKVIIDAFGTSGSGFLIDERGLDENRLFAALADAERTGEPVCLIGASFGFVNLLDKLEAAGTPSLTLPAGSRLMDAGGYKGRSRELDPAEFRAAVSRRFGVPESSIVNLLGMTELASQIYDATPLAAGAGESTTRCKCPPHWVRTRVLDVDVPLGDAAAGEMGLLAHYDLANFSRPLALLSDDLGLALEGGFQVIGRVKASEARGCSLKVDELLAHTS
jgi:hypothetical protein